jgi:hypothetical protein
MEQSVTQDRVMGAVQTLAGPALLGACAGFPAGAGSAVHQGAAVPVALLGVTAMMVPALYIGASFAGVAPSARRMARATTGTLRDMGRVSLGLAPALAFMAATSQDDSTATVFGFMALGAVALLGLRALYLRLFAAQGRRLASTALYAAWSLVSLGIGWQLMSLALEVKP